MLQQCACNVSDHSRKYLQCICNVRAMSRLSCAWSVCRCACDVLLCVYYVCVMCVRCLTVCVSQGAMCCNVWQCIYTNKSYTRLLCVGDRWHRWWRLDASLPPSAFFLDIGCVMGISSRRFILSDLLNWILQNLCKFQLRFYAQFLVVKNVLPSFLALAAAVLSLGYGYSRMCIHYFFIWYLFYFLNFLSRLCSFKIILASPLDYFEIANDFLFH